MSMLLQIENIAICNAACVFCPYPTMTRQRGTMSMDLFKKIIDEAAGIQRIEQICITGLGEPLLDKHLVERIKYIRETVRRLVIVGIFTNGTYLTEEKAQALADAGVTTIHVSLNAITARQRKEIMKIDDYDLVVKQIRRCMEIFKEKGLGQKVIVKGVQSKDLMEGGDGATFMEEWGGPTDQGGNGFLHLEGNWAGAMWPMRVKPVSACSRALGSIMVLWDGRVSLCCFDSEGAEVLGDVNHQTLREVFAGEKAYNIRKAHVEGRRGEIPLCANCTSI